MMGDRLHETAPAGPMHVGRNSPQQAGSLAHRGERVQAWHAWSACGDGAQVHLIIDPTARQVWLLQAGEPNTDRRSVQ